MTANFIVFKLYTEHARQRACPDAEFVKGNQAPYDPPLYSITTAFRGDSLRPSSIRESIPLLRPRQLPCGQNCQ